MIKRRMLLLGMVGTLGACAGARENGAVKLFGVFGRDRDREAARNPDGSLIDPRPLIDQVISLRVERNQGGAIIHAIGLPAQQGYYDGELVVLNDGVPIKGVLSFEFRAAGPKKPTRVSTQRSREILVGLYLVNQQLEGVRRIEVIAARNRRSANRR